MNPKRHAAWMLAAGLLGLAPSGWAAFTAHDDADNSPYPGDGSFEGGQDGGSGFQPWVALKLGLPPSGGGRHLVRPGIRGSAAGDYYAWGLNGGYAMGRPLAQPAKSGTWTFLAVHTVGEVANSGFSGFSLKSSTSEFFGVNELLRFGFRSRAPDDSGSWAGGICLSINGGQDYTFIDRGWGNGSGDTLSYSVGWEESGSYTLTVHNWSRDDTFSYDSMMPPGSVAMLGAVNLGVGSSELLAFDTFLVSYVPEPAAALPVLALTAFAVTLRRTAARTVRGL